MKISFNWLKDHITFQEGISTEDLIWRLTEASAEVEEVEKVGSQLEHCVVGKIEKIRKHSGADKLVLCDTNVGTETIQIVCGGINLKENMLVAVALPGAYVRWHGEGEPVKLEKTKIRGEESTGMICLSSELSLENIFPEESDTQILDLSEHKLEPGIPLAKAFDIDDTVLHIDNHAITHRPDLFSHLGIAREYVALGLAIWNKKKPVKIKEVKGELPFAIATTDESLWSHYQGIIVKNLDDRLSPLWMRKRLSACGIRAISALVDLTNYAMLDVGMPSHAFDTAKLPGKEFLTRLSVKGEKVTTLDGVEREMPEGIIIIENDGKIVDLCGVMGGENSGIEKETNQVFFHCVAYEPVRIRKAMISLGHRTDAGTIFEKGVAPELAEKGLDRVLELTMEIFPKAEIVSSRFIKKHFKEEKRVISIEHQKIENIVGMKILKQDVVESLKGLGFFVETSHQDVYKITVPFWRKKGVNIEEDLIEEIIRIIGFSKVEMALPYGSMQPPIIHLDKILGRKIREVLIGHGFFEEQNYSFIGDNLLQKIEWSEQNKLAEIINPVSDDLKYMRPSLLPYLLNNAARNIRQSEGVRSFELQKTFKKQDKDILEEESCVGVVAEESGALKAKGVAEDVLKNLGIKINFQEVTDLSYGHPGRSLNIELKGEIIGSVYELKPSLRRNFELPEGTAIFELNIAKLSEKKSSNVQYQKISKFPRITLDVNVVVDQAIRAQNVENWIRNAESSMLSKLELKDIYEGENLGENKKSLTYSLSYQSLDRTLEEKEVQAILNKVISELEKHGGMVRR